MRLGVAQALGVMLLFAGMLLGVWELAVCGLVAVVAAAALRRKRG